MLKILVIDDNRDNPALIRTLLENSFPDYDILTVQSGPEGIEKAEIELPDVIILDIKMSDMDDYEVCKRLQSDENTQHIPVILITAYETDSKSIVRGLESGALTFLSKPINKDHLLAQINTVLRIRKSEMALQESEKKFRNLIESAGDFIYIIDNDLKFLYGNSKYLERRGLMQEELLGKEYGDFHSDDGRSKFIKRVKAVSKSREPIVHEYKSEIDGRYFLRTLSPIIDSETKELESITVISRDITKLKQAQNELTEKHDLLRILIDNIHDHIYVKDLNCGFLLNNKAHLQHIKIRNQEEALGKNDFDVYETKLAREYNNNDKNVISTGNPLNNIEEFYQDESGNPQWLLTTKVPMRDRSGNITGLIGISRDITERKNIEEALRTSERRYAEIAMNIPGVICQFFMKKNGAIFLTYVSEGSEKMYKITSKELLKTRDAIYYKIHPGDNKHYIKSLKKSAEDLHDLEEEYRLIMDDGSIKWLRTLASPQKMMSGDVIWNGVTFDITEFKQSVADLGRIFNMSGFIICVADIDGYFRKINPAFSEALGYSEDELLNRPFIDFVHPEDKEKTISGFTNELKKNVHVIGFEHRFRCNDGSYKWLEWSSRPVPDENLQFAIAADITRRKTAETALIDSERKFQILFENAPYAYYLNDLKGTFIDENKAAENLTGYRRTELIGKSFMSSGLLDKKQIPKAMKLLARNVIGKSTGPDEFILIKKGGNKVVVEIVTHPVKIKDSNLVLGVARDITTRKMAEDQLKLSEKKLRELAQHLQTAREMERTNIAREIHDELGQLTTAIKMDIVWLKNKLGKDKPELLNKLLSMSELTDMTNEAIKRISSELRPGIIDDLGLIPSIEWHVKDFQSRTGIQCDLELKHGEFIIDPDRTTAIYRILQESLTNVIRHSSASEVKISLLIRKKQLFMQIFDNGKGIPADRIEDPKSFGLIGIQERAAIFGGSVVFTGEKGKGTTVKVILPI